MSYWMDSSQTHYHFEVPKRSAFVVVHTSTDFLGQVVTNLDIQFLQEKIKALSDIQGVKMIGEAGVVSRLTDFFLENEIPIDKMQNRSQALEVYFRPSDGAISLRGSTREAQKIKAFVVDDSVTIRKILRRILEKDGDIDVIAESGNPVEALEMLKELKPDVITLDIHMPHMSGVEMLRKYYPTHPIPTIMVTSIRMEEGPMIIDALESGAVDYFEKPSMNMMEEIGLEIRQRVRMVSKTEKVNELKTSRPLNRVTKKSYVDLIAFGASTGGTKALRYILSSLPADLPPIAIVQHMPPVFTNAFAERLNSLSAVNIKEAEDGESLKKGWAYIAPGGKHMDLVEVNGEICCRIGHVKKAPTKHVPAVDVMFSSIPKLASQPRTLALLLTGMGKDGSLGLQDLKKAGQCTVVQDRESSVVWGMPGSAVEINAHDHIWDLEDMPRQICEYVTTRQKRKKAV